MSFNLIWDQHQLSLYNFIYSKTNEQRLSEDLLQEIAIKLHQNLERNTPIKNYRTWLFQVTRNTISDYYRSLEKAIKIDLSVENPFINSSSEPCVCDISGFIINNYLPENYGRPLYLSDIDNIPQKEIADLLGISLTATKSRIQRARVKLSELVNDCVEINYNNSGQITDFQLKPDCELPPELLTEMERIKLTI